MSNNLKKLRVAVSIIVLLLLGFLLVDFRQVVPEQWIYYITRFQLIPAIISVITISGFAVISLIILLLLTLLFGRIYCSTLCPLGAFQDVLTRFFNPQKRIAVSNTINRPTG